ncbi:MAG: formylglycine-generating enzyme family protein [Burkholderiales bacterium]|nr:formylglycine-generating enzyme family protein [Burkholderiales bacterium]
MSRLSTVLTVALACTGGLCPLATAQVGNPLSSTYVDVPAGTLASVLANDADRSPMAVSGFAMRITPVTRGEFRRFVATHPQWQPGQVPRTFADAAYLQSWSDPLMSSSPQVEHQPTVQVSWFAAQAYCDSEGARLPTWTEWEYVAAADATRTDARSDPAWLAQILAWYARPATAALPAVGGPANVYGVRNMHGLIWEWVDDFNALMVNADSRSGDDPDKLKFCGAGAINLKDKQNYAVLMRIALLSSLQAADSTTSLGFRCVRPSTKDNP